MIGYESVILEFSHSPLCETYEECVCSAWAKVCDIVARVESSWKSWRKNSLQLDLDPTSFTLHRQCSHLNLFLLFTFRPFFTFLSSFCTLTLQLFSISDIHLFAFSAFEHSTSCSATMLNFFNSFSPFQLFCHVSFLRYSCIHSCQGLKLFLYTENNFFPQNLSTNC